MAINYDLKTKIVGNATFHKILNVVIEFGIEFQELHDVDGNGKPQYALFINSEELFKKIRRAIIQSAKFGTCYVGYNPRYDEFYSVRC